MAKIAPREDDVTDEMFESCNKFNIKMIKEYLANSSELSPKTLIQYTSALKIYAFWIKENLDDKSLVQIKSREYLQYQNWLNSRGLSDSAMKLKRSAISSLNGYIMLYYQEEYPTFRNYITKQIKVPVTGFVHKKEPLNPDEYLLLCKELEKREEWQKLAYVKFTYITGCRKSESMQLLKEVVNYTPTVKMVKIKDENGNTNEMESKSYKTHDIRCKGKGKIGKVRKLQFDEDAMDAIKKWLEIRGEDDCPYVFVVNYQGKLKQVGEGTFNDWCNGLFEKIVGRRIHPHLFRESRATNLVVYGGKDMNTARKLLGHQDESTTKIYVIREDTDDADEAFV